MMRGLASGASTGAKPHQYSLLCFSFCIRHASSFLCSQRLQPPRRIASRVSPHQRKAYVYVCIRARRFSHQRLLHTRARLPIRFSRPLYTRARLPLWRASAAVAPGHFTHSRGKSTRHHVHRTRPRAPSLRDRACVDMPASTPRLACAVSEKCVHFPLPAYTTENSCTNTLGRHNHNTLIRNSKNLRQFHNFILTSELLLLYTFPFFYDFNYNFRPSLTFIFRDTFLYKHLQ